MALRVLSRCLTSNVQNLIRVMSTTPARQPMVQDPAQDEDCGTYRAGLVLGVYSKNDGLHRTSYLTPKGEQYNNLVCGKLTELLNSTGPVPKLGEAKIFYQLDDQFTAIGVVGLGEDCAGYVEKECIDQGKENIRVAAGAGARALQALHVNKILLESFGHTESAAEGAALGLWLYKGHKSVNDRQIVTNLDLYDDSDWTAWQIGLHKASAQNLARQLMETPANIMTPINFAQSTVEILCKVGVNVEIKVQEWAEIQGMGGFLSVARGSCQDPIFLELSYFGTGDLKERPIVLVGKGCTFDSGGIGLRHPFRLELMKGDMAGAASVVATVRAIALMNLPINIRALIPLCEHMPGCNAMKPGDVCTACNGKSILIEDTRCEGRLMLADALAYGQQFWPKFMLDIGSMTKGIRHGLSTAACGVYSNSDCLWEALRIASVHTGDRVWRMPLFDHYGKKMVSKSTDLRNHGRKGPGLGDGFGGDPCKAAAFLREFVPCGEWMHLDTYGVMVSDGITDPSYLRAGMAGRPTRTLIEFLSQFVCKE